MMTDKKYQKFRTFLFISLLANTQIYANEELEDEKEPSVLLTVPEEVRLNIFTFVNSKKDFSALSSVCKTWNQGFSQFIKSSIDIKNYNKNHLKEQRNHIALFPRSKLQNILGDQIGRDSFIVFPRKSALLPYLPDSVFTLKEGDLLSQLEVAKEIYKTLFGQEIPITYQNSALSHLLSIRLYFGGNSREECIKNVFTEQKKSLIKCIANLAASQSHFSFFNMPEDLTIFEEKKHTIAILDTQLEDAIFKTNLKTLLDTNPHHKVIIIVGKSRFIEGKTLKLSNRDLPPNIKNLSITNPEGNVETIGDQFLYGCENLTSFDTSGFSNIITIGYSFLCGCKSLTSFDTLGFINVRSIKQHFLSNCESLTYFDASGLTNLKTIGYSFLYGCVSLTSFNFSGFTNVTTIEEPFLHGCTGFSREEIEKIKHSIISKGRESTFEGNCVLI